MNNDNNKFSNEGKIARIFLDLCEWNISKKKTHNKKKVIYWTLLSRAFYR